MKTDLFQSCGHCQVFQICWHIECSTFTASSFRIWKSSTGIPSPPLALFVVMLPKAPLTSHSRMSGSRWVITPSWLSGSWSSFLYSFCVFLPPLLNIFCFSGSLQRPFNQVPFTSSEQTSTIRRNIKPKLDLLGGEESCALQMRGVYGASPCSLQLKSKSLKSLFWLCSLSLGTGDV